MEVCRQIEVHMDVENSAIRALAFYGDYFGNGDSAQLVERLIGAKLEEVDICARLGGVDIGTYFNHRDVDLFCSVPMQ